MFGPEDLSGLLKKLELDSVESGYLGSFFIHIGMGDDWTVVKDWPGWLQQLVHYSVRLTNGVLSFLFRLLPLRPHSRALSTAFFAAGTKPRHGTA